MLSSSAWHKIKNIKEKRKKEEEVRKWYYGIREEDAPLSSKAFLNMDKFYH